MAWRTIAVDGSNVPTPLLVDADGALVISLSGGAGGVVTQGARDATGEPWYVFMCDPSDGSPWLGATELTLADIREVVALDTTVTTLSNKFPTAFTITQTTTPIPLSMVGCLLMAREPNAQNWRRLACNTSDELLTSNKPRSSPSGFSTATGYEQVHGIASSFALHYAIVEVDAAGWVFLVEGGTSPTGGEEAKGGLKYQVTAGQTLTIGVPGAGVLENFTGGLWVAFSSTQATYTPGGTHMRMTVKGE